MNSEDIRLVITVALPCLTVLIGILINNNRISDLSARIGDLGVRMGRRFEDLGRHMDARFALQDEKLYRVEQVLDARLKHIEERR
jgi:hypothetical protein